MMQRCIISRPLLMLLKVATLQAIADNTVDLVFRRWKAPRVTSGARLRTAVGELRVSAVDRVNMGSITDDEARRAGFASRRALLEDLRGREGHTYRITLTFAGPDERVALRRRSELTPNDRAAIAAKLERMDARSPDGPWTARILATIAARPATRAAELAGALGMERDLFKRRVRRLKELGLTTSLELGYELSPRGRAFTSP